MLVSNQSWRILPSRAFGISALYVSLGYDKLSISLSLPLKQFKNLFMKYFLPLLILGLTLSACAKKKLAEQAVEDEKIIQNYIAEHDLDATPTGTGLYYTVEELGEGASCNENSTVRVAYKGYLTSGTVFDESEAEGIVFGLQEVIEGWTEGIPLFKEGGKGTLLIPSALGYGGNGPGTIPDYAVLIFDIHLIEVL